MIIDKLLKTIKKALTVERRLQASKNNIDPI